ncbi:hypothetical protein B738_06224 [Photorhabdus temperata subsp. temperata M1021]|nr:hypothetical protein B738_06224 [Photorhabdus temperata subsp. temperata M1021]
MSVVESGSFSRAAEHLQLANSAVSRSIKKTRKETRCEPAQSHNSPA